MLDALAGREIFLETDILKLIKSQADCGFEAGNAERSAVVFESFFVRVVWRVVGRDSVDGTVFYCFEDCLEMLFGA